MGRPPARAVLTLAAILAALTAILAQPSTPPDTFVRAVLACPVPILRPDFIGCTGPVPGFERDDWPYAGWRIGGPVADSGPVTGP